MGLHSVRCLWESMCRLVIHLIQRYSGTEMRRVNLPFGGKVNFVMINCLPFEMLTI